MKRISFLALAIVLFLAACGSAAAPSPTTGVPATGTPGAAATATMSPGGSSDLDGTKWTLVSFGPKGAENPVVSGSKVTLEFEQPGKLGGTGGCNGYGADYQVEGNTLAVGAVVSTLMACADEAVNQQEQQYFRAIQAAGEYQLSGDQLVITYDNGAGVLTFAPQS
jgi:heat shock protein HslJ